MSENRSAAIERAIEVLETCGGEDYRRNGCACSSSYAETCYLHGVTIPEAIRGLRSVLAASFSDGLPADLVRVLRDPTIVVQRDHEVRLADGRTLHEHLEEWRNAPSNTASGGTS